jgi:NADPH-dependent curcumin reductase CurA
VCGADRHTTRGDITAELQTRTIWTSTGVYGLKALSLPILRPDWAQAISQLSEWLADGSIMTAIQMWEGLESAPEALLAVLAGESFGQAVVRIAPDPS